MYRARVNAEQFADCLAKIAHLEKGLVETQKGLFEVRALIKMQRSDHEDLDDLVDEHGRQIERVISAQVTYRVTSEKILEVLNELLTRVPVKKE